MTIQANTVLFNQHLSSVERVELLSSPTVPTKGGINKHVFVLFGWNNVPSDMDRWYSVLRSSHLARDHAIWNLWYDKSKAFNDTGDILYNQLQAAVAKTGDSFASVRMLCYSMGGLVGRHLVECGMPCTRLASIASPHLGLMGYVPPADNGVRSLKQGSRQLAQINSSARDEAARPVYFFGGISYRVINPAGNWYHDDDQVVDISSSLAYRLSGVGERKKYEFVYKDALAPEPFSPHRYPPLDPNNFPDIMQFLCS